MIVTNAPRNEKAFLGSQVSLGLLPLYLVSPKQTGESDYRFATKVGNRIVLIGKSGVAKQNDGFKQATTRYGQKAKKIKV